MVRHYRWYSRDSEEFQTLLNNEKKTHIWAVKDIYAMPVRATIGNGNISLPDYSDGNEVTHIMLKEPEYSVRPPYLGNEHIEEYINILKQMLEDAELDKPA